MYVCIQVDISAIEVFNKLQLKVKVNDTEDMPIWNHNFEEQPKNFSTSSDISRQKYFQMFTPTVHNAEDREIMFLLNDGIYLQVPVVLQPRTTKITSSLS
jgi:hypothetical protein